MNVEFPASIIQINHLRPLKKWRILSLKKLMQESNYLNNYQNFTKMIYRLEKKKLIESFIDPFNKNKYVYLTESGNNYLTGDEPPPAISSVSLVHDSKVVELVQHFLKYDSITSGQLEHELMRKDLRNKNFRQRADAILHVKQKNSTAKIAFELELTRKARPRYLEKARTQLSSYEIDYIIYFFNSEGILRGLLGTQWMASNQY